MAALIACSEDTTGLDPGDAAESTPDARAAAPDGGPPAPDSSDPGPDVGTRTSWRAIVAHFYGGGPYVNAIATIDGDSLATERIAHPDPGPAATCGRYGHGLSFVGGRVLDRWWSNDRAGCPDAVYTLDPRALTRTPPEPIVVHGTPHAAAVVTDDKAYVSAGQGLYVVDLRARAVTATISIAVFQDAVPFVEARVLFAPPGGRAYAVLARPVSREPITIVAIDIATDRIIDLDPTRDGPQGLELGFTGLVRARLTRDGARLVVASAGREGGFDTRADAGIEVVDLAAMRVVRTIGSVAFNVDPVDLDLLDDGTAIVAARHGPTPVTEEPALRVVDLRTGAVRPDPLAVGAWRQIRVAPDGDIIAARSTPGAGGMSGTSIDVLGADGTLRGEVPLGAGMIVTSIDLQTR